MSTPAQVSAVGIVAPLTPSYSIWQDVSKWVATIPLLFVSVGGNVDIASGPVAFRFTAMAEDSSARRLALVAVIDEYMDRHSDTDHNRG